MLIGLVLINFKKILIFNSLRGGMRKLFIVGVIGTILGFTNPCIAADGNAIYNKKCSGCHGVDGKGIIIGLKLHQKLM